MTCRFCGTDLGTLRSSECIACGAVTCLRQEFTSAWDSQAIRIIAADICLGAARSVRALRLASNRLVEGQSAARRIAEPQEETRGPEAERPRERGPRVEVRGRAEERRQVKEEPREEPHRRPKREDEKQDSLSESYTEDQGPGDERELEPPRRSEPSAKQREVEKPAGVTPKSAGVVLSQAKHTVRSRSRRGHSHREAEESVRRADSRERQHHHRDAKKEKKQSKGGELHQGRSVREREEEPRPIPSRWGEYSIAREEEWLTLELRIGDIFTADLGGPEEDGTTAEAAFLAVGAEAPLEGSQIIEAKSLGASMTVWNATLSRQFNRRPGHIHVCPGVDKCDVVDGVDYHVRRLTLHDPSDLGIPYISSAGKKLIKQLMDGPPKVKRPRGDVGREKSVGPRKDGTLGEKDLDLLLEKAARSAEEERLKKGKGGPGGESVPPAGDKAKMGVTFASPVDARGRSDVGGEDGDRYQRLRDRLQHVRGQKEKEKASLTGDGFGDDLERGESLGLGFDPAQPKRKPALRTASRLPSNREELEQMRRSNSSKGVIPIADQEEPNEKDTKNSKQRKSPPSVGKDLVANAMAKMKERDGRKRDQNGGGRRSQKRRRSRSSSRRRRRRGSKRGSRRRRGPGDSGGSGGSDPSGSSDGEEDDFSGGSDRSSGSESEYLPPLLRKCSKKEGSVLELLLQQIEEQMDQIGADVGQSTSALGGVKVLTYFNYLVRHGVGPLTRDGREMYLIAVCLDFLRTGGLAKLGDALAGRFMALHQATLDQSWDAARNLELFTPELNSAAGSQITLAARRHSRVMERVAGTDYRRPGGGKGRTPSWWGANDYGWEDNRPKGKKSKGKGKKGNPWGKSKGRQQYPEDTTKPQGGKEKPQEDRGKA
eukprot:Skav230628  [mRNA]  locus=scaffold1673:177569:180303:+ [translate_table: standard]